MKAVTCLILIACSGVLGGCAASIPPLELADARQAYSHASATPASQRVPAGLLEARDALIQAEQSFLDNGTSNRTRDLATIAYRKAKLVAALSKTASDSVITAGANKEVPSTRTKAVEQR